MLVVMYILMDNYEMCWVTQNHLLIQWELETIIVLLVVSMMFQRWLFHSPVLTT